MFAGGRVRVGPIEFGIDNAVCRTGDCFRELPGRSLTHTGRVDDSPVDLVLLPVQSGE